MLRNEKYSDRIKSVFVYTLYIYNLPRIRLGKSNNQINVRSPCVDLSYIHIVLVCICIYTYMCAFTPFFFIFLLLFSCYIFFWLNIFIYIFILSFFICTIGFTHTHQWQTTCRDNNTSIKSDNEKCYVE